MNKEIYPDIEIYVYDTALEQIMAWVKHHFGVEVTPIQVGQSQKFSANLKPEQASSHLDDINQIGIPVTITPQAAGKKFTAISFDSAATPWDNDLECARDALAFLQSEIRCAASGWLESPNEEGKDWWKLTQEGEFRIDWKI